MFRPQFSLKTLLWVMAVVAAFVGGLQIGQNNAEAIRRAYQRQQESHDELLAETLDRAMKAEEMLRQLQSQSQDHAPVQ
jgi:hypothetical protein